VRSATRRENNGLRSGRCCAIASASSTSQIEARIDSLHDVAQVRGVMGRALDASSLDDVCVEE
jgi:hypothetical protein